MIRTLDVQEVDMVSAGSGAGAAKNTLSGAAAAAGMLLSIATGNIPGFFIAGAGVLASYAGAIDEDHSHSFTPAPEFSPGYVDGA